MQCTYYKIYTVISECFGIGGGRVEDGCVKQVLELGSAAATDAGKDAEAGRKLAPGLKFPAHLLC